MASGVRISLNERSFIESALRVEQRIDGRRPFDVRRLVISFSKEDGAVEVQQGETRVMAVASAQLGAPYPDRPNEGSLAIFTEFSPMADPNFEPGRPGELAVELGRIVDRGLRESRAVDTESLCVLAGRAVWAIRLDLHILDNGGNLVDVANVAALAALLSFRRPECSLGGEDGQEVIVHSPEVREPLPLSIHHLPIAVTFAFFSDGELVVVDPSLKEEAIMGGRLTVTVNTHGEVCAIQKGGGVGVSQSEVMRCLRIAATKATDVTNILKKAVETNEIERTQRKIRRHRKVELHKESLVSIEQSEKDTEMTDDAGKVHLTEQQRVILTCKEIIESRGGDESIADMENGLDSTGSEDEELHVREAVLGKPKKAKLVAGGSMETYNTGHVVKARQADTSISKTSLWNVPAVDTADANAASMVDQLFEGITQNSSGSAADLVIPAAKGTIAAAAVYAGLDPKQKVPIRPLGPIFPILGAQGTASITNNAVDQSVGIQPKGQITAEPQDGVKRQEKKRKKARGFQRKM